MSTSRNTVKRTYDLLQAGIRDAGPNGTTKKARLSLQTPDSAEVFNRFVDLGKAIPRLIHPFRSAHLILNAGQVTAEQRITDAAGNPLPAEAVEFNNRNFKLYTMFLARLPLGAEMIAEFKRDDFRNFRALCSLIQVEAAQARANDTKSIRPRLEYAKTEITGPIPDILKSNKSARGFNSIWTGQQLIPVKYYKKYMHDTEFRDKVNHKKVKITAKMWPAFIYTTPADYNPEDIGHGLLKSRLLLRVCKHIFFGPSDSEDDAVTNKSIAGKLRILLVTAEMVAYSAVQARFMLSHLSTWKSKDGNFSADEFYDRIVSHLTADNDWARETLKWWQTEIFSTFSRSEDSDDEDPEDGINGDEDDEDEAFLTQQSNRSHSSETPP